MPNATATRPYDDVLVPAVAREGLQNGVVWKSYKGDFPWVPDMRKLSASKVGVTQVPNTDLDTGKDFDALYFEGYIEVPEDGRYTFYLTSNGSGLLRVHDATVIDAGHDYFANSPKSGSIRLKAGLHPFRQYYVKSETGKPKVELEWSGSQLRREEIPTSAFHHVK